MNGASSPSVRHHCAVARILLVLQVIGVGVVLYFTGKFERVYVNDSPGYVNYPWQSLEAMFGSIRTPGFPAFLKLAELVSAEQRAVPFLVFIVFVAATIALFEAMRIAIGSVVTAAWAASSLLYAKILHGYVHFIATDTLAAALGIFTCAALLLWLKRPREWTLFAIAAISMLAWLVRPTNMFLCAFVPAAGWILQASIRPDRHRRPRAALPILTIATCLPLVAYATLRWAVIGNWGIVSFGGYNAIGIAGQFITPDLVERIPEASRPIAAGGLRRRAERATGGQEIEAEPPLNYMRIERQYDQTIWEEFAPAATEVVGDQTAQINAALGQLAVDTIRLRPLDYAAWLAKAMRQGVKKLWWDLADNPVYLGMLLATTLVFLMRVAFPTEHSLKLAGGDPESGRLSLLVISTLAVLYAGFNLAAVIPVCPPLGRMTDAAGVLLPAVLFGALGVLTSKSVRDSN